MAGSVRLSGLQEIEIKMALQDAASGYQEHASKLTSAGLGASADYWTKAARRCIELCELFDNAISTYVCRQGKTADAHARVHDGYLPADGIWSEESGPF